MHDTLFTLPRRKRRNRNDFTLWQCEMPLLAIGAAQSLQVLPLVLISGCRSVKGWYSGTAIDSQAALLFSVFTGVRSMNEVFPLERMGEAYDRMMNGKARLRAVLDIGQ